jgi:hypothetical protein
MDIGKFKTSVPMSNIQKSLDDLRNRMAHTKELTDKYNQKYNDLVKFNKLLTDGYINNLHVIVDISSLLNSYKLAMSDILTQLSSFETSLLKDIDDQDIAHIRQLTSDSLRNVGEFFKNEVSKIKDLFVTFGREDVVRKLNQVEINFVEAQNTSRGLFKGGGFRVRSRIVRSHLPPFVKQSKPKAVKKTITTPPTPKKTTKQNAKSATQRKTRGNRTRMP